MALSTPEDSQSVPSLCDDASPTSIPTSPLEFAPPSPPPLPPLPPSRLPPESGSVMSRKFKSAPPNWLTSGYTLDDDVPVEPREFSKVHYFFYGTLKESERLSQILEKEVKHTSLRPAQIVGYTCEMWGVYKALVDGPMGAIVEGVAYEVQSKEDDTRLAAYETNAYETASCMIDLKNDKGFTTKTIYGRTFKYAGDPQALKEKRFDRKLWMKNMEPMFLHHADQGKQANAEKV